jgi:hypothetical protein
VSSQRGTFQLFPLHWQIFFGAKLRTRLFPQIGKLFLLSSDNQCNELFDSLNFTSKLCNRNYSHKVCHLNT